MTTVDREGLPWREVRPDKDGNFDELVFRFGDAMVHIETMSDKSVYIGFYCDDGRSRQLWISSAKKLRYNHDDASGPPPRFTAQGVDRARALTEADAGEGATSDKP